MHAVLGFERHVGHPETSANTYRKREREGEKEKERGRERKRLAFPRPCVIVIYAFCAETDLEPSKDPGPNEN